MPVYFDQECPICGRNLRVRVQYQGRRVVCQHCRGEFEACDPQNAEYPPSDSGIALMQKADDLLSSADSRSSAPQATPPSAS